LSYTLAGPPERISPFGFNAATSAAGISKRIISEYTWHSRIRRAMTCVYCEPKSRMRIFECVDLSAIFSALRMSLGYTVLCSRVARRSLQRAECSLAGHSSFKLPLNFLRCALLQWVGAATQSQACDRQQDRHAFHLRIL